MKSFTEQIKLKVPFAPAVLLDIRGSGNEININVAVGQQEDRGKKGKSIRYRNVGGVVISLKACTGK